MTNFLILDSAQYRHNFYFYSQDKQNFDSGSINELQIHLLIQFTQTTAAAASQTTAFQTFALTNETEFHWKHLNRLVKNDEKVCPLLTRCLHIS